MDIFDSSRYTRNDLTDPDYTSYLVGGYDELFRMSNGDGDVALSEPICTATDVYGKGYSEQHQLLPQHVIPPLTQQLMKDNGTSRRPHPPPPARARRTRQKKQIDGQDQQARWQRHRALIKQLYVDKENSLEDVMVHLREQHHFDEKYSYLSIEKCIC